MATDLYKALRTPQLAAALQAAQFNWGHSVDTQIKAHIAALNNGNLERWLSAYQTLPTIKNCTALLDQPRITLSSPNINETQRKQITASLQRLIPWRKGPFEVFGTHIDTEWRSDYKWARIEEKIAPLDGKMVLDIGCANGYFSLRMAAGGAKLVVGVDPSWLFMVQFMAIRRYLPDDLPVYCLPFTLEEVPKGLNAFDTVFSMGVLYHRRSVFDHFLECFGALKPGGQLVLETLVIAPEHGQLLVPKARYARMRNVWFIPNTTVLCEWLERAGFIDPQVQDESDTTLDEQRATPWMQFESLEQCLDPKDPSKTIEGYPAPRRALVTATKPHTA